MASSPYVTTKRTINGVCPLRSQCVAARYGAGRTVALHPQEALLQQPRDFQRSEGFSEYRRLRQAAEHRLARLVQLVVWAKERDLASVAGEELARVILQARRGHIRARGPDMTGSTAGCLWPGMTLSRDCPDQTDSSNHVTLWDGSNYKRAA